MDRLLGSGAERLAGTIRQTGRQITYWRGGISVTLRATTGRSRFEIDDGYGGVRVVWNDLDFLIPADDLVLDGIRTLPQRQDVIETENGLRYEVLAPANGPEWEYVDPFQRVLRVHTMAIT